MNTRIRIAFSTMLGLSLVGLCLGSAQAQTGTKKTKAEKCEMKYAIRHEEMDDTDAVLKDDDIRPAPLNYPFAAPGGLHLFHFTDYSMEGVGEGSAYEKRMENRWHRDKMLHERLAREEAMMTDEDKKMMREPAPLNYPFSAPGGLHLFHYTDYSMEGIGEGSAYMRKMDKMEMREEKVRDRMRHEEAMMTDEEKKMMREPAPIGYPFAAPGGLHLYHYTDYSMEGIGEGSATMRKSDKEEMREKHMKMKKDRTSN